MLDSLTLALEVNSDLSLDREIELLGDLQLAMIGGGAGGNVALD